MLVVGISDYLIMWLKRIVILLALLIFYTYGFLWSLKPRRATDMKEVLKLFYHNFLRLRNEDIEIVKLTDKELITISRNPCPILNLTLKLGLDTKHTCRIISEAVCKYVLKQINPKLQFERNYNHIRPYKNGCLERIYLQPQQKPHIKTEQQIPRKT